MNAAPTPYGWLQPLLADAGLAEPLALTAPEQRVGRTELKTSRKLVSKAHAILAHTVAGAATVEDRSVNGTFLNGARLPQNDPAPLQHGDVVTLLAADSAEFAFVYVAAAALGPPAAVPEYAWDASQTQRAPHRTRAHPHSSHPAPAPPSTTGTTRSSPPSYARTARTSRPPFFSATSKPCTSSPAARPPCCRRLPSSSASACCTSSTFGCKAFTYSAHPTLTPPPSAPPRSGAAPPRGRRRSCAPPRSRRRASAARAARRRSTLGAAP